MNAYTYESFKSDMIDSITDFINNTDYKISWISESSFLLSNNRKDLFFYIEAMTLYCEISNIDDTHKLAIYEIFINENMMSKYPKNLKNLPYEKWNKYKVRYILEVLRTELKKYI